MKNVLKNGIYNYSRYKVSAYGRDACAPMSMQARRLRSHVYAGETPALPGGGVCSQLFNAVFADFVVKEPSVDFKNLCGARAVACGSGKGALNHPVFQPRYGIV